MTPSISELRNANEYVQFSTIRHPTSSLGRCSFSHWSRTQDWKEWMTHKQAKRSLSRPLISCSRPWKQQVPLYMNWLLKGTSSEMGSLTSRLFIDTCCLSPPKPSLMIYISWKKLQNCNLIKVIPQRSALIFKINIYNIFKLIWLQKIWIYNIF